MFVLNDLHLNVINGQNRLKELIYGPIQLELIRKYIPQKRSEGCMFFFKSVATHSIFLLFFSTLSLLYRSLMYGAFL